MSRVGKQPIKLPANVKTFIYTSSAYDRGSLVRVEGPKGNLEIIIGAGVQIIEESGYLKVSIENNDNKQYRANYGTTRAKISNLIKGVTDGWKKSLEMNGVGYNAKLPGDNTIVLSCGFSHEVKMEIPKGISCKVTKNQIDIEGYDLEEVGRFASEIRKVQPPEPYLGKGIKYIDEQIRRKAGKTGKK
jgi:large subunit ribosomal protein L6